MSFLGISQGKFHIVDSNKESITMPFVLANNLVVISAEVNGKELSFLLDTGIVNTILFNLKFSDSLELKHVEKIHLRGLGEGVPIEALRSKNNLLQLKGISNPDHLIYIITDDMFELSSKMGMDVHGIIGGDLFKDFIVKINYSTKKITFYRPDSYDYKSCKKCETFPLEFFNQKPFINAFVENQLGEEHEVKLLIDSGGGDALWLFKETHPKIMIPDKYFDDYLGMGLNGDIYGKRGKIAKFRIGSFIFENASVSYPDSISIVTAVQNNKKRNGTFGAEMLKRFHVVFDYPNKKVTFKKNKKYFNDPFSYNKSGIEIVYGGEMLVKEINSSAGKKNTPKKETNNIIEIINSYNLAYKPSYVIAKIRENSPAYLSGLMVGDIILEINGSHAYDKKMEEIIHILSGREHKKIKLLVSRKGKHLKYEFYLKDLL
ncbi:MAG: aspartyl protease family protein [Flavobacteriaceae bacterium]|nr:aspartyl protease family protein [Flavobacteriaceae bacterium]